MAVINTQQGGGGGGKEFVVLPSDVYRMKVIKVAYEENRFADPNADGTKPMQITLTWEVTQLTDEQSDAADEAGEDWNTANVLQYLNPYYGPVRKGGVSKFQTFIDGLREQGYLVGFNANAFDPDTLLAIEQRVSIEKYKKSQGDNAGKWGNKVVSVLPLGRKKAKKNEPQPVMAGDIEGEEDPF